MDYREGSAGTSGVAAVSLRLSSNSAERITSSVRTKLVSSGASIIEALDAGDYPAS